MFLFGTSFFQIYTTGPDRLDIPSPLTPPLLSHLLPQNRRASEHNHPPRIKRQISTGGRVSPPSLRLLFHHELPEPADQDIVSGFQGLLDQFENVVDLGLRLLFGEAHLIVEGLDKVFFCEGREGFLKSRIIWDGCGRYIMVAGRTQKTTSLAISLEEP
jgi:hypothetical protein